MGFQIMNLKMTHAWGWLVAGVLAAGLNASYHDGGLQWAHQVTEQISYQVEHRSAAVLDLATGHADRFLSEARLLTARTETPSCPWAEALAQVQTGVARSRARFDRPGFDRARFDRARLDHARFDRARFDHARFELAEFDHLEVMSDRRKAELARLDANRQRLENRIEARVHAQVATQMAHFQIAANFAPASLKAIPVRAVQINKIQAPVVCRLSVQVHE